MNEPTPTGACERTRLLLCLQVDGAATRQHEAEIAAHLPGCEACRRARAADLAVRARLAERADAPVPAWSAGFAQRTASLAVAESGEARAQNRILWMSAAAAVLAAAAVQFAAGGWAPPATTPDPVTATVAVRESTRVALLRATRLHPTDEGK